MEEEGAGPGGTSRVYGCKVALRLLSVLAGASSGVRCGINMRALVALDLW